LNKNSVLKPSRSAIPDERGAAEKPTLAVASHTDKEQQGIVSAEQSIR